MSKLNDDECRQSVLDYFQKQKKYKLVTEKFNQIKNKFYSDMEEYFIANNVGDNGLEFKDNKLDNLTILVKCIQNSSVKFDASKLSKKLPRNIVSNVIDKRYEVTDIKGLINYLKESGCDPKIFKSFIVVTESVNVKELERLEEIGKITAEQIKGCYTVKSNEPYYKVSVGKGQGDSD